MKKITIVGAVSPTKTIIRTSLELSFDIVDLIPQELNINNIGTTDIVIYVAQIVDNHTFERLRTGHKLLVLISTAKSPNVDLFIQIADFQNSVTEKILKRVRLIKEFIDRSSQVILSDDYQRLYDLLREGLSEEDIRNKLGIGRTKYYEDRKHLRLLLGAENNGQLPYIVI